MKAIKQEDPYGCGAACVASVLNISYQEVLNLFTDGRSKSREVGFYCREMVGALEKKGLTYEYRYIKKRIRNKIYRTGTIVFVQRSKRYPAGHYLARIDDKWMDPWINFPAINVKAGFRKRLPERPIYAILPV